MKNFHVSHTQRVARIAALIGFLLILAGCGGLGGEPRIVATMPPATAAPTEVGYPLQPPDLANGAAIFSEHCTRCHGVGGAGDGDLVASGQITNVASFIDPTTAREQRPSVWEATITSGRIDNGMPPWRDALTEQERWDVAMYTYTLSYGADLVTRGAAIYADQCAECHGDQGLGDGPRSARLSGEVANLQNQSGMATLSDLALFNIINEGSGDAMPAFGDELNPDEILAVGAFVRTLSLANADVIGSAGDSVVQAPNETAEPSSGDTTSGQPAATTGTITGRITNGTAGASVPADTPITLFIFPANDQPQQVTTTPNADGTFQFDEVSLQSDAQYITTTNYRDRIFTSDLLMPDAGATTLDLPLTIYELTEDTSVIEIGGLVTQVNVIGDNLEVAQVFSFRNTSDRAFTTGQTTTNGQPISVVVSLPPGSVVTGLGGGQDRYVVLPNDYLVVDTSPVLPGENHLVQVVYLIPYNGSAIVEQPMQYPVNGQVRLLIRPTDTAVQSAQLPALSVETIGQTDYQSYGGDLSLAAGDVIRYDVSGSALDSSQRSGGLIASSNLPVIILIVIVVEIVLIGGLYLWYRQRRGAKTRSSEFSAKGTSGADRTLIDGLIRQIAELDAAYQKGEIAEEAYQSQRAALKARLAELMTPEK
ncbi:MAG: c-type cytochrome [Anaerolineae bacterium]